MKIAALQWDVRRADVAANLAAARDGLSRAREQGVQLLLLPEMWATSFPDAGDDLRAMTRMAQEAALRLSEDSARLDVDWAGSGFAFDAVPAAAARPFNRLELFSRGERHFAYDKLHLFGPMAEDGVFQPGAALPTSVPWRGLRLSGVICYDLRFPEATRAPFHDGAELLLVPAQWPSPRSSQWRALVHGLAASGQCFVLACNRTGREIVARRKLALDFPGNSLVVGPAGETLAEGHGEAGLISAEIDATTAREWRRQVPVEHDLRRDIYGSPSKSSTSRDAPMI